MVLYVFHFACSVLLLDPHSQLCISSDDSDYQSRIIVLMYTAGTGTATGACRSGFSVSHFLSLLTRAHKSCSSYKGAREQYIAEDTAWVHTITLPHCIPLYEPR